MKCCIAIVGTLFSCAASWSLPARAPAAEPRPQVKAGPEEYPRSQLAPLAYGKDFFEVSSQNTIRRRFSIRDVHNTPPEPFSGKPYGWSDVKHDCWLKLPQLGPAELAKLTGLPGLTIDAPVRKPYDLFTVAKPDRPKVLSPCIAEADESDVKLNNQISTLGESAAVLRTATGHWLLVTVEQVDLYVDMLKMADKPGPPLPVYGYVLEGLRPLVLIQAPPDLPVPSHELGYFRR